MVDVLDKVYYVTYREMKNDKKRIYYYLNKKLVNCICGGKYVSFDTYKNRDTRNHSSIKDMYLKWNNNDKM